MLAARRACGGKAVVLMRPSLPMGWFDYAIVPEHDGAVPASNIVVTKGVLNAISPSGNASPDKGLILIGGPSKHHCWKDEAIVSQVEALVRQDAGIDWKLTTSRRTPGATVEKLRALKGPNLKVVPFEETAPGWVAEELNSRGSVWVSEDSVSMIFEALTAGARVGVFEVPIKNENSRVVSAVSSLVSERRVVRSAQECGLSGKSKLLAEADRVATLLIEKIGLN
jgi:mitochondrial fission protein ELM1